MADSHEDKTRRSALPQVSKSTNGSGSKQGGTVEFEPFTDAGNANRFLEQWHQEARWVPSWKCWLVWDGSHWKRDELGRVKEMAKGTARAFTVHALRLNDASRDSAIRHALRSEHASRLEAMVTVAKTDPGICIEAAKLDTDPYLLNCLNGTIDLRTGKLRTHDPRDQLTKISPVTFNPDARDPIWERFLREITRDDLGLAEYLQRVAGYSLTGETSEEILLFLLGPPLTGKTTFLEAMKSVMGDYAGTADFETFLKRNQPQTARNDLARLKGVRLVTASEAPASRAFDEATIKQITGGDTITTRFLYGEYFEYRPQFTIWLAANHQPTVRDNDPAMWRRLKVVPFENSVSADARDSKMKHHLTDPVEAGPAVLAWMVCGALKWQKSGLREPSVVTQATSQYRSTMETFSEFVEECCVEGPEHWVQSDLLFEEHERWSRENIEQSPQSQRAISKLLRKRGCEPTKRNQKRGWQGIGLKDSA